MSGHSRSGFRKKIVETDASDVGSGGTLKQKNLDGLESIVQCTSSHWNDTQKNYSTIKKKRNFEYSFVYSKFSKRSFKKKFFEELIAKFLRMF